MRLLVKNIGTIVGIETAGRLRLCFFPAAQAQNIPYPAI